VIEQNGRSRVLSGPVLRLVRLFGARNKVLGLSRRSTRRTYARSVGATRQGPPRLSARPWAPGRRKGLVRVSRISFSKWFAARGAFRIDLREQKSSSFGPLGMYASVGALPPTLAARACPLPSPGAIIPTTDRCDSFSCLCEGHPSARGAVGTEADGCRGGSKVLKAGLWVCDGQVFF